MTEPVVHRLTAPMAATVASVAVADGDAVRSGQTVIVLEVMKMEHPLVVHLDGTISHLAVAEGEVGSLDPAPLQWPALAGELKTTAPLPAVGYQLPIAVDNPTDAATLAVRMEDDAAVAWRAVLEQAPAGSDGDQVRTFAVSALTQSAVLSARWKRVLKAWPLTQAFPGGQD